MSAKPNTKNGNWSTQPKQATKATTWADKQKQKNISPPADGKSPQAGKALPVRTKPASPAASASAVTGIPLTSPEVIDAEAIELQVQAIMEQINVVQKCISSLKGDTSTPAEHHRATLVAELNRLHEQKTNLKKPAERVKALNIHLKSLDDKILKAASSCQTLLQAVTDAQIQLANAEALHLQLIMEQASAKSRLAAAEAELVPVAFEATVVDPMAGALAMLMSSVSLGGVSQEEAFAVHQVLQRAAQSAPTLSQSAASLCRQGQHMPQAMPAVGPQPSVTHPVQSPAVPVSRPIRTPASWAAGVINTATLHRGPEPHLHSRQVQEQIHTRFLQHQIPPALPTRHSPSPAMHGVAEAVSADAMAKQQVTQLQLQQRQQQQLQ